jgi:hypothetical protein
MMFRNLTFNDLQRLKQIDSYSYLQHTHFTSESIPDIPYFNESETIKPKPKSDSIRISETIKQLKLNACNKQA